MTDVTTTKPGSIFRRLYDGTTDFRFVGRRRLWFALSLAVIAAGLVALGTQGLNLGIDFEGGTSWEVPAEGDVPVEDVRAAVEEAGLSEPTVQTLRGGGNDRVRVEADTRDADDRQALTGDVSEALAAITGADPDEVSVNEVGPSWGENITDQAVRALLIFLLLVSAYIAVRFEWKMAVATLVALLHDILVTVGVYAITGLEVTPATVIAFLTILGYSIYDGIVVFDKVDENAKAMSTGARGTTYSEMVDASLNEVLMRTLNTSITALLPILSLLVIGSFVLGATTLEEFALALLIGLAASAYSSIFIASPILAMLKEREPRFAQLRARAAERAERPTPSPRLTAPVDLPVDEPADDGVGVDDAPRPRQRAADAAPRRPSPPLPSGGSISARPRKKGKRR